MSATYASAAPVRCASLRPRFHGQMRSPAPASPRRGSSSPKCSRQVIDVDLKPNTHRFLRAWRLRRLCGRDGNLSSAATPGVEACIQVMEEASKLCLSTGFLIWCQTACARYIQMSDNSALKASFLPRIARRAAGRHRYRHGEVLRHHRGFPPVGEEGRGGYVINGVLPGCRTSACALLRHRLPGRGQAGDDALVFVLVDCQQPASSWSIAHIRRARRHAHAGLPFQDASFRHNVLSHPGNPRPMSGASSGHDLAQMGWAGLIEACVDMMKQSNKTHAHVNQFLDDQAVTSRRPAESRPRPMRSPMRSAPSRGRCGASHPQAAPRGGEYAVKAAHAAMLHMGAKGYLQKSPAQRRLRESYFIAIVTPATKHLRREIARIESAREAK